MTANVIGHLADVSFDTGAATAKGSMPRLTALSPPRQTLLLLSLPGWEREILLMDMWHPAMLLYIM